MRSGRAGVWVAAAAGGVVVALGGAAWLALTPASGPEASRPTAPSAAPPSEQADGRPSSSPPIRVRRRVDVPHEETPVPPGVPEWAEALRLHRAGRSVEALQLLREARLAHPEAFTAPAVAGALAAMEEAVVAAAEATAETGFCPELSLRLELLRAVVLGDAARARLLALVAGHEQAREAALLAATTAADQEILARHLRRFGFGVTDPAATPDWVDAGLRRMLDGRAVPPVPEKPLADADPVARERRRVAQLEKLREREVVAVLDPIHAGLSWLALHQGADGEFSDTVTAERCGELAHGDCLKGEKTTRRSLAATALAVLAFLDFRDQDARGVFEPNLTQGVRWLQSRVRADGSLGQSGYDAAIALLALGQATVTSDEPGLRETVERAWSFAAANVGPNGGFRYAPAQAGDLSVTGWYVQAYEAAADAHVEVPQTVAPGLLGFTRSAWRGGSTFSYLPGQGPSGALESVGMLSLVILGAGDDQALRKQWLDRLAAVPDENVLNLYRLYYDVRVDILLRGAPVEARRAALLAFADAWQIREGAATGRFATSPKVTVDLGKEGKPKPTTVTLREAWITRGGPTVFTAFSVLTLEHALYRR